MKTEKTFFLPSMLHEPKVTDQIFSEFRAFVGTVTKQKYIFLSKNESIVVDNEDFSIKQLPPNVNVIYLKIESANAFVEVKHRSRFKNLAEVADKSLNAVTIQGPNQVNVRGLYVRLDQLVDPQKFLIRTIFYRHPVTSFWISVVLLWLGEYRVGRLIWPHLSLNSPLSALGAIVLFSIALGTFLIYGNLAFTAFSYWFPYFEIEGNISKHRLATQKVAAAIWTSLLASGVWNLISLLHISSGH